MRLLGGQSGQGTQFESRIVKYSGRPLHGEASLTGLDELDVENLGVRSLD